MSRAYENGSVPPVRQQMWLYKDPSDPVEREDHRKDVPTPNIAGRAVQRQT